ncbi:unnamed protein product [Symbiodinium microadriaticum]|nr:unnamed protein product [Symbiodinium microadriaticum]
MAKPKRPSLPSKTEKEESLASPYISFSLLRKTKQRTNDDTIYRQVEDIVKAAVIGERKMWQVEEVQKEPPQHQGGSWHFRYTVTLTRRKGRKENTTLTLSKEKRGIMEVVQKKASGSKYGKYPWDVLDVNVSWEETANIASGSDSLEEFSVNDIVDFDEALTWDEIEIPEVLINGTDEEIERHPAFSGIFGRAAHIRVIFSSIKTMCDTQGMRRNHCMLWGLPACAKSQLMMGVQQVLGKGAFLAINGNSATKAGIETIFLKRLKETGTPPVVFIEEIEKTLEAILTVWLSILDDRAEVRKVTYHDQGRAEARVLVVATANDKILFDRLMGGRPKHPGAISSRFTKKLYVPRPDDAIMRKILARDIKLYGGKMKWIDPCIEIMRELNTNDPRTVLSFLDGQEKSMSIAVIQDGSTLYIGEDEAAALETFRSKPGSKMVNVATLKELEAELEGSKVEACSVEDCEECASERLQKVLEKLDEAGFNAENAEELRQKLVDGGDKLVTEVRSLGIRGMKVVGDGLSALGDFLRKASDDEEVSAQSSDDDDDDVEHPGG